ncbi:LysE family translocator [Halomarina halobia]|uniref:LysE family translocator n=1 Tax=Halomarina halobia TaxID=3033386 RepID=A0ABD6A7X4_9EURY|nr:LysE family translocator [Halomarina sp. PSR21]
MPDAALDALALFLPAAVALVLTPGPDTIYVLSQGVGRGRGVGVRSALGVSTGVLVHATLAAFGLSVLVGESPLAYATVKLVGAAYLVYLGVRTLRTRASVDLESTDGSPYVRGVLVNVLNPKVALFFLAFLPQFVVPGVATRGSLLALGATYALLTLCYLGAVALLAGRASEALDANAARLRAASGGVLLALGAWVAAEGWLL